MTSRFFWVLATILSYHWRHPLQTLFLVIGLVTGVALWGAVQQINAHARASYAEADQFLGAEARFWVRDRASRGVPVSDYVRLRRLGFTQLYPVIETRVPVDGVGLLPVVATDLLALPLVDGSAPEGANNPFSGDAWTSLVQPNYEAWYPANVAARLGIEEGERLQMRNGTLLPPAVIQTQPQQGDRIFMDIGATLDVLSRDEFTYLALGEISAEELERLAAELPESLQLVQNQQAIDLAQLTESLHTNLTALGLLSFAVGMFIVFNAIRFSLTTRQQIFSTLRELGVPISMLAIAIALESIIWSVFGAGAGGLLGYHLGNFMLPAVASTMQNIYGAPISGELALSPMQFGVAFLLTLFGVVLAVALPLWQRVSESIREGRDLSQQWSRERTYSLGAGVLGSVLLVISAMAYSFIDSVISGFVLLACTMFGGAMLLPVAIRFVAEGVGRLLPESRWSIRWAVLDSLAQLPHLRVALMALLLTLVANIGVTTLVGSFRTALGDWLDVRLSADLYVQSDGFELERIEGATWLQDMHQRAGITTRFANRPTNVIGVDPAAPDTRELDFLLAEEGAFDRWAKSEGEITPIVANEQVRYLAGFDAGDVVELESAFGVRPYRIVGFIHDYGNADFEFYLPLGYFESAYPESDRFGTALWINDGQLEAAEQGLLNAGARSGEWIAQGEIRRISFAIFDRTFEITAALNGLTLLVAGIALLSALLAIHQSRLPEYSFWRSMGMTWREWLLIVATPLLLMALITGLAALPLGLVLSWLLIHQLNVIAFGWTMPLAWGWSPIFLLAGITFAIVMGSLAIAVLRVRQTLPQAIRTLAAT